jgi:hypothetical protein
VWGGCASARAVHPPPSYCSYYSYYSYNSYGSYCSVSHTSHRSASATTSHPQSVSHHIAPAERQPPHRTRRASASVGAQIHCARIRTAHTRFCSATITSYAHPCILAGGHLPPRQPHRTRRASASVGASIYCARTRTAHTRFCSATITPHAHPYFWPEAIAPAERQPL